MIELSPVQLRLARLASQRLAPECADDGATPARVLADVCGVQAQNHASALAGTCLRQPRLTAEQVERARVEERTIAVTWLMRGTLHMVASEDLLWLVGLFGPMFAAQERPRLRQLGVPDADVERAVAVIAEALAESAPLSKAEIAEKLVERGIIGDGRGQRPIHLIAMAASRGLVCLGPRRGGKPTYALVAKWLGVAPDLEGATRRAETVAELARRYLEAFGPATSADFAYWSGLPARDAKAAFAEVDDELEVVRVGGDTLRARPGSRALTCAQDAPRGETLRLPSWDNYLMGYADRGFALGPGVSAGGNPNGGVLLRAVIEDGLVVGKWEPGDGG